MAPRITTWVEVHEKSVCFTTATKKKKRKEEEKEGGEEEEEEKETEKKNRKKEEASESLMSQHKMGEPSDPGLNKTNKMSVTSTKTKMVSTSGNFSLQSH